MAGKLVMRHAGGQGSAQRRGRRPLPGGLRPSRAGGLGPKLGLRWLPRITSRRPDSSDGGDRNDGRRLVAGRKGKILVLLAALACAVVVLFGVTPADAADDRNADGRAAPLAGQDFES